MQTTQAIFLFTAVLALVARCLFLERKASRDADTLETVSRSYDMVLYSLSLSAETLERLSREKSGTERLRDIHGRPIAYGQRVRFSHEGENAEGVVMMNISDGRIDERCPFCIVSRGRPLGLTQVHGLLVLEDLRLPYMRSDE